MTIGSIGGLSSSYASSAVQGGGRGGSGQSDPFVTDLASKLGVSTSALQKAMDAARQQVQSSESSTSSSKSSSSGVDKMSTAIASQLGIDATTVQNAVNELRSAQGQKGQGGPGAGPPPPPPGGGGSSQLMDAVADTLGVSSSDLEDAFANAIKSTLSSSSTSSTTSTASDASTLLANVARQLGVDSSALIKAFKESSSNLVNSYA